MFKFIIRMMMLIFLASCMGKGKIDITLSGSNKNTLLNLNVAQVQVLNNQLVINGSNLSGVTQVRLVSNGVTQNLSVESASSSQLVANGISAITIGVGKVFDMILSNANAAATVPVTFTLDDNSITGIKLNDMGANNNDVLTFNGSEWIASAPFSYGLYQGNWDPASGAFPSMAGLTDGDFYIVSVSGTYLTVPYVAGDWIILDGGSWLRIQSGSNSVSSYNGRNGLVVTVPADYVLLKNGSGKLPGSSLNDLANVDLTTTPPVNGNVLKYNGVAWVPGVAGGAAGAVGSTEITDLSITGADVAENTINLSKLYSPSSNAALYLRGDKTWANFVTDVLNAPLSTYALSATAKPSVLVTDTLGPALGKLQKFLNDLDSDYISKTATSQTVSGTFSFTSPTSFLYTQLPTGASPTEVANVQYVQNYVGSAVSGLSSTAPGTLTTANGAAASGDTTLNVVSTTGYPTGGTLVIPSTGEAISYSGITATSFTGLTRGAYGTSASAISNGATIDNYLFLSRATTSSLPKMVVTGSGNVGIGIATPSSPLYVYSTVSQPIATFGHSSANRTEITNGGSILHTYSTGTDSRFHLSSNPRLDRGLTAGAHPGDNDLGGLFLGRSGTFAAITSTDVNQTGKRALSFWTGNDFTAQKMYISDSGNVGIGTTTPLAKNHVEGTASANNGVLYIKDNGTDDTRGHLVIEGNASPTAAWSGFDLMTSPSSGTAHKWRMVARSESASSDPGSLVLWQNTGSWSHRLYFTSGGSLGVSENVPVSKMAIRGNLSVGSTTYARTAAPTNGAIFEGNVGIGTSNPTRKFVVIDPANGLFQASFSDSTDSYGIGITANDSSPSVGPMISVRDAGVSYRSSLTLSSLFDQPIIFSTNYSGGPPYTTGTITERMRLDGTGLGIGNNAPSRLLHVGSAATSSGLAVANFQNADGTCTITPASSGSGIACSSDERLKENFENVLGSFALDRLLRLQAVTYNFKTASDDNRKTGYKAQEVQKIAPEFVRENDDGFLQVYYDAFIPWITEAIKTLYTRIISIESFQVKQDRKLASVKAETNEKILKLESENKAKDKKIQELEARLLKIEKALDSVKN